VTWPLYLVAAGAGIAVLCSLGLLRLPDAYDRLHLVTPVTSLAAPLVCIGLAINDSTFHGVFKYLFIGVLVAVLGPAASIATARAAAAHDEAGSR
jgi:monovalent cation/proton antiporter MnhG/PhaG subunit